MNNTELRQEIARLTERNELRGKLFDQTLVEVQKRHQRMSAAVRQS